MDDNNTVKYAAFFAIGIGLMVFCLGFAAYLYF